MTTNTDQKHQQMIDTAMLKHKLEQINEGGEADRTRAVSIGSPCYFWTNAPQQIALVPVCSSSGILS